MNTKAHTNDEYEFTEKIKSLQSSINNINKALNKIKQPNNDVLSIQLKELNINCESLGINEDFFSQAFKQPIIDQLNYLKNNLNLLLELVYTEFQTKQQIKL